MRCGRKEKSSGPFNIGILNDVINKLATFLHSLHPSNDCPDLETIDGAFKLSITNKTETKLVFPCILEYDVRVHSELTTSLIDNSLYLCLTRASWKATMTDLNQKTKCTIPQRRFRPF